jgi:hypothetical protein
MAAMKASARQQATLAASQAAAEAALVKAQNEAKAVADAEAAERRKERNALLRLNKSLTRHNSSLQSQLAGSSALVSGCVYLALERRLSLAGRLPLTCALGMWRAGGTLWRRRWRVRRRRARRRRRRRRRRSGGASSSHERLRWRCARRQQRWRADGVRWTRRLLPRRRPSWTPRHAGVVSSAWRRQRRSGCVQRRQSCVRN